MVAPVVFVEIIIAIIAPMLFLLSVVPINSALRFITYDRVDIRKIMPKLLPFISFKSGEKHNYWVAIDTFYFPIKDEYRQTIEEKHNRKWYHLCDTSKSTVVIFFILAVNFLLAWSVFVNGTLVDEFGPESCSELTNVQRQRAVCLTLGSNLSVVNCSSSAGAATKGPLLCFQFLRFSEQTNIITSLTGAIVLYFITEKFIAIVLDVIRFFYLFHESWIWAGLVILIGALVICGDAALILAALLRFTTSFDLGQIFEYLIIGVDIILVGILLLISTPLELVSGDWKPSGEQYFEEESAENKEEGKEEITTETISCEEDRKKENGSNMVVLEASPQSEEGTNVAVIHLEYKDDSSCESSEENDSTD